MSSISPRTVGVSVPATGATVGAAVPVPLVSVKMWVWLLMPQLQLKPLQVSKKQEMVFPFKRFVVQDFEIWVGKNAANNDILTQKYSHKNDLWLHAKGVTGSHTIIKHKAGKLIPSQVLTIAAQIAAYYSKHKGNTLAPVCYTLKKFVRKPKGFEPGQVVMDREEVIMVEPKLP